MKCDKISGSQKGSPTEWEQGFRAGKKVAEKKMLWVVYAVALLSPFAAMTGRALSRLYL
jgi:hypothetical protein